MMESREALKLAGQPVDIAPFGHMRTWTGNDALSVEPVDAECVDGVYFPVDVPEQGGTHMGMEWDWPRQFETVVFQFEGPAPDPAGLRLQYWNHNWPAEWNGGWTHIDDPHNGQWITAHGDAEVSGDTIAYKFDPLDFTEVERARDFSVFFRQSYRLRLLFKGGAAVGVRKLEVLSTSRWDVLDFEVSAEAEALSVAEVQNGYLLEESAGTGKLTGKLLYADTTRQFDRKFVPIPPDRTAVVLNVGERRATVGVNDLLEGPVHAPDLGLTVTSVQGKTEAPKVMDRPIFDRIPDEPEQSYERASSEIPQLVKTRQNRYVMLGCDANRQEFALRYNGDISIDKVAMKSKGRDTARLLLPGTQIRFKFPTMDPPDFREREEATRQEALEGWMPVYASQWRDRQVMFRKTDFAALLEEEPWDEPSKRGDEPVCAFSEVEIRNASEDVLQARFWVVIEEPEALEVRDGGFVYSTARLEREEVPYYLPAKEKLWQKRAYEQPRLRAQVETLGRRGTLTALPCSYEPYLVTSCANALLYEVELGPRESHTIRMKIPFVTFTDAEGEGIVERADYDQKLQEMTAYWRQMAASGAQIDVPSPHVNEFLKATLPQVAISVDKDVSSGLYLVPAATYGYEVCANEAMHQVRALDLRGYHDRARVYLKTFLDCQGTRPMHGKFRTQHGVLHGLRVDEEHDYQMFNYNLDHGFVLFSLCEHFFLTRDDEWAQSVAQNVIDACDFVTRERQYTKRHDANGNKVPQYGLIPPGHLEDNPEWLYWYAVNAYCYRGMAASAEMLRCIGHPQAGIVLKDAEDYREDLRRSMRLHMEHAPLARLLDGESVPFTPTRAQLLNRDLGWIRESLYGPIHSIECGVLDANEDQSTWILKDSEDNVFVSKYRGRLVDLERRWFSQGGNTIQSGLLPMVMVYVKRDQPEHAIRSLFNGLAQNLYADVHCFTEHPVPAFGIGWGPFYKTPDECCWVNWLRHILLAEMDYQSLRLAPATPRAWLEEGKAVRCEGMASYFGPVSFDIRSEDGGRRVTAQVEPPVRNAPERLELRLRHPGKKRIQRVEVNGREWSRFDAQMETVDISGERETLTVTAFYGD